MPVVSTISNFILSIIGRGQSSRDNHLPVDMESRTLFAVKRQSPNAHLRILRNPSARIEDKLEFLAPALHNSSQTYIDFLQGKLDAHVKHTEAEKLVNQRLQRGQELNWPQRTEEDLKFGYALRDYAREYLILPRDTFSTMDKALLRKKERDEEFERNVAEKMRSQGWIMNLSDEWDLIRKRLQEEAEEGAKEQDEVLKTAIREGEAKSLNEMAEHTKGKTFASENDFYDAEEDSDDEDEDEDEDDNSEDYVHIYSYPDPPAKNMVTPEAHIDNDDQKSVNPLSVNTTTDFIMGLPTPPSSPPSEPEVSVDTTKATQFATIQRPPTPPMDSPEHNGEQASHAFNWADDAIEAAEDGETVTEEGNYDAEIYEEELGDSQSSEKECYDGDSDSDSDSSSEADIQFGHPLRRFNTLARRKVCWVEPELETILEEEEDEGFSEDDISNSDSDSEYESEDEEEESFADYQPQRRASDPEEYAKMTLLEFHLFLELNNQERSEFFLPSINQHVSPLMRETFALDYDQRSQSDFTDDGNPPASLPFEAASASSTISEAAATPTPAQRRKTDFLCSLHQAKKEVREEMEAEEMKESALRLEERRQRHRENYDLMSTMTLISLRLRMETLDNLIQDPTNTCIFKKSPSAAANGAEEVLFVGRDMVTAMEVDQDMGILDQAVRILKVEGTWLKYEKKDCMKAVRESYSKATLLPEVSRLWEERRWHQERSYVRKMKEKMDINTAAQMDVIGELIVRLCNGE